METDQTRHETEESLTFKKLATSRHISNKLQNGGTFSDGDPLQITSDRNWNNYKASAEAGSMKRQNETCNDPGSLQGLLDQGSFTMNGELMNGDFKHVLAEQSFLASQPKKFKVDSEISELTKNIEFECNAQAEIKLGKSHCTIPNGDHFALPRNKQLSINGAVLGTSTIESTPGDLLERTLSQYYPEQVSIAPQRSGTQDALNGSLTTKLPGEDCMPSTLTSDFPGSAQILKLQQRQPETSSIAEGVNNFDSVDYIVNGYSNNHDTDYQQKKQQHQQQAPSCAGRERSLDQLQSSNIANALQQPKNGPRCYPNSQPTYENANQDFDRDNFKELNTLQTTNAVLLKYGSSPNSGIQSTVQRGKPGSGHAQQFEIQPNNFQQNVGNIHGTDGMGTKGPDSQQRIQAAGLENSLDTTTQQKDNSCSGLHQGNWMEPNPSKQQTRGMSSQAGEEKRGFSATAVSDQSRRSLQVHGQILEARSGQRFESPGMFKENIRGSNSVQEQQISLLAQPHCASAPSSNDSEWQQCNSNANSMQKPPLQTKHDQQVGGYYHAPMQSKHLHDNPELQDTLSPEFFTTQQPQHCNLPRPLSHPPQFEEQQLKSPIFRPHSQPQPSQVQLNQQHKNSSAHPGSHFHYKNTAGLQGQCQRSFSPNSGSGDSRHFQPQRPNNCHPPNIKDLPHNSTQSQSYLPQGAINQQILMQAYPKTEHQLKACSQVQRGSHPGSPIPDFQKHEALRMHLLQRQERLGPPHSAQNTRDSKIDLANIKIENGPRFNLPSSQQQLDGLQIKQETQQSVCENTRQNNILASMEQSLKQYQLSPVFEKKSFVMNSNRVKVESSGPVTILSTNTDMCKVEASGAPMSMTALKRTPDSTPKKEQLLQRFMDSPMKLLDTPIKSLLDTPIKTQYDIASCHCVEQISEKDEGPYYTHLGSAPTVAGIREEMERRSGLNGQAIRIEKVVYTGKEGKSTQGCPIAKWVIRRASVEEKLLVLVRERTGHKCETACIIVAILVWEGIQPSLADKLYLELSETLTKHGALTQRRCALNEERTCACQGLNPDACGASFSFGCSWSMYYNGCKFARSKIPRKFKLQGDDVREEERLEQNFQGLATLLGPLYKNMAPEAYGNQVEHEHRAPDCRLGFKEGRPFSGVTACLDFCAHAHRDLHNMQGGSTVVCTLTREDNREIGKIPEDEQLHVLPLYKVANTDEYGSEEGQQEKIKSGAIQALSAFRRQVRMLAEPAKSCRQKKLDAKKAAAIKNTVIDNSHDKAEKVTPSKSKTGTCENVALGTLVQGAMGASQHPDQASEPFGGHSLQPQYQQHENILTSYPGAPNAAKYPRFPGHPGSFPSTSKPGGMFHHQASTPANPYPSPVHAPNSFMDGSKHSYPVYQCNGGMPLDNYHPYYASNQKQLDMYQQQRQVLYSEQQYAAQQRYELNYPQNYADHGLQVNGYNAYSMRPVHPMRAFSPCSPNGVADPHFMDALSRTPTAHRVREYPAAGSHGNQFGRALNPYLGSPQMFPPSQQPFHMQIKQEMGIASPKVLGGQFSGECLNPETQIGLGLLNGNPMVTGIKQEPGALQRPPTPQKPEIWSDNEHNFLDPEIGGVAVAPSHGSVLIECAKRELHATTPLKNPDRHHPTRISLVFYQHKNLNEAKHGLAMWEAKMAEKAREKEEDADRNGGEGTPGKGNKKGTKREHPEPSESLGEPPYKRFIKALIEGSSSCTTNTYVSTSPYAFTKVTGPYSHFA